MVSSSPPPPQCPSDLDLARFADGRLDGEPRAMLVGHLADCDDCREILATVLAAGSAAARYTPPPSPPLPVATRWPARRAAVAGAALALAALTVFALRSGVPSWTDDGSTTDDAWAELAAAVGPARSIEARLSGLTAHVPLAAPTRGSASANVFALQALASRLADAAAAPAASADRSHRLHLAGVAALVAGKPADAVTLLGRAIDEAGASSRTRAERLSDLAAAHAELGETTAREHWGQALRAADDALALDATLAAAHFNRALALEHLGRPREAIEAWRAVADDVKQPAAWRDEAMAHLHLLTVP